MSVTDPRFMLGSGCECNAQSLPPQDEVSGLAGLAGLTQGDVYQTTAANANGAGVLMVKQ